MREIPRNEIFSEDLLFPEESYALMGAAFEVYKEMGPGFLEAVYQAALIKECERRGIPIQPQVCFEVEYKGEPLGKHYLCDLLAYEKIILELKAIKSITKVEMAQTMNYLKVSKNQLALLLNFGAVDKLEWKRIILSRP